MKPFLRSIAIGLYFLFEGIIAFIVLYVLLFITGGVIPVGDLKADGDLSIYVKTNGVHTDICLPVETVYFDWKTVVPASDFPNNSKFKYVSIGWGDKGFFLDTPEWSDLTFNTAFSAAFLASGTAMHVSYLEGAPKISNSCAQVFIDEVDYIQLIAYIKNSFALKNGHVDLIANKGYGAYDNFYEAEGNYHLFKTCNAWTNNGLKLIGVKTGSYALSSEGIMRHLR